MALSPWIEEELKTSVSQLIMGSNFISSLEVVSALNSLNLACWEYHYNYINCTEKYNPKVYFGAVHTQASHSISDSQDPEKVDEKWAGSGNEKSGSWP